MQYFSVGGSHNNGKDETALLLYTEVHTFTIGVGCLPSPSVDHFLPWNIHIFIIFILVTLLWKKKVSGIVFRKHLVHLNGNIFSCDKRKYLISCRWRTWKSSQRLWRANWKCYHNFMFRKCTLSIKNMISYLYKGSCVSYSSCTLRKPWKHSEWWRMLTCQSRNTLRQEGLHHL